MVLLHGLADDHGLWRHIGGTLEGLETFALDLPGHGRSSPIPHGATMAWMADAVLEWVDGAGFEAIALAGLSMCGGVAQTLALARPSLVRELILVSTSPVFPASTRQRFLDRAAMAERNGMAAIADQTVSRWFVPDWMRAHPDDVERTIATVEATDRTSLARASRLNADRDVLDRLAGLTMPVLFIGGLEDPADPVRAAEQYAARVPDLRIELIPGVSHLIPVEAPDQLRSILATFLADAGRDRTVWI